MAGSVKRSRQTKREVHYALNRRDGSVFLIQRPADARLMAGMWELPEIPGSEDHSQLLLTVRHSITVTDYTVKVWARSEKVDIAGGWWALDRLPKLALTGLARKILRTSGILPASGAKIKSSTMVGTAHFEKRLPGGLER